MTATEHELQSSIIDWKHRNINRHKAIEWLHAVPNGAKLPWHKNNRGQRYSPEANKLKAEGLTPGIPDLCLPFPAHDYHGLYIELKRPGNIDDVREGQKDFMAYAESVGYLCQVHDDYDHVIELLCWYLDIENNEIGVF